MQSLILLSLLCGIVVAAVSWFGLWYGRSLRIWSFLSMVLAFALMTYALEVRGEARGACPLADPGEILLFLAWSMSLVYLVTGGTYRLSLLGLFTSPAIVLFLGLSLIPGMISANPVKAEVLDPWKEAHAATSVLSYGALGMSALAGVMFFVLNRRLKAQKTGWFTMKMPPVSTLVTAIFRLLLFGVIVLTLGIIAGFMTHRLSAASHLYVAGAVWLAYILLLTVYLWKGLTPRILAGSAVGLFCVSCFVFFII